MTKPEVLRQAAARKGTGGYYKGFRILSRGKGAEILSGFELLLGSCNERDFWKV